MAVVEDIVIIGAGIAGLTTSLGLHRLGYKSTILESSNSLRSTGFALTIWANAWKALDAVGVGDSLRQNHHLINGNVATSMISGETSSKLSFQAKSGSGGDHEIRCLKRVALLETLEKELPADTIRFSSKVVHIEESVFFKLVHLSDGTILTTKVLIGCDGVNSVVANWLGFKKPVYSGRFAFRGSAVFKNNHGFEPKFHQFFGEGVRAGFIPCDGSIAYWFFTHTPSTKEAEEMEKDPSKIMQYMMSRLGKGAENLISVIEKTESDTITSAALRFRYPWDLLLKNISKDNVCVAGDALHPMTPDIGQGGCSALEDSVVLARCLAEALSKKSDHLKKEKIEKEEFENINAGLKKYANERKWRSFRLIATSYMVGKVQQGDGKLLGFFRDKFLLGYKSTILESSNSLRSTGFALTTWSNAWRALDAVGVGDSLRQNHHLINGRQIHHLINGNVATSMISGETSSKLSFQAKSGSGGDHEVRCLKRVTLLETLQKELPADTIRFSSKVVHIEESGFFKLVHLSDGTILTTKVLIGCDGVNSVVANWLGFKKPVYSGRFAFRGYAIFKNNHGFEPKFHQFFREGVRAAFIPCDDSIAYWFFTHTPSTKEAEEMEKDPSMIKQYMMSRLGKGAENLISVIEKTESDTITSAALRFRYPWDLLLKNISKDNVCVAGDALHPMTPDIGQGGGSALEDGVVLARCLAEALSKKSDHLKKEKIEKEEFENINAGLKKYANERKWRSFTLIATSYMVGKVLQGDGKLMGFFRDMFLSKYLAAMALKVSDFDCGKLSIS